jgi:simple sugar transport system ATP-binding protein
MSIADPADISLLRLENVSATGLSDFSLGVRPGEIVGVAGVAGNGQRELGEVIVGTRPVIRGTLFLRHEDLTRTTVRERLLLGLGYVPEDRIREGILPHLSVAETFALGLHHSLFRNRVTFDESRVRQLSRDMLSEYKVVAPSERAATARLSGGNIQKVLVARAIRIANSYQPTLLVAMNPARGLDIGTTALVHRQLSELRNAGGGVLLVSEDLDELMQLCDRIVVMYRSRKAGEFARAEFDAYRLGSVMAGAN